MQTQHYKEIGKYLGRFPFKYSYNEDTNRVPQGGALGDLALNVYSMARSMQISIKDAWSFVNCDADFTSDTTLSLSDAEWFASVLDEYKRAFQLFDFSDFLDEANEILPLELLIIDEGQDLTRQQWSFVRRVGAQAKRVLIAGDDDQAIFQWAGADLTSFLNFAGDLKVLPVSYRLPENIWMKACWIAEHIKMRRKKEWRPRPEDKGRISYASTYEDVDLGSKSWMLLTRLQWQTQYFVELCRSQGVVYQFQGVWSNQTPPVRAVINYERIRRGEKISGAQFEAMMKYIDPPAIFTKTSEMGWEDAKWFFEGRPDWMTALNAIGSEMREYIKRLRRNNESLVDKGRVIISTIHGVKGGEADNVFLMTDVSRKVVDGMTFDSDAENRVWYVAVSRAKHHLRILEPQTNRHVLI
jgi:DNA helicase-2/ATP-dependent DNA helicase PcrA